MGTPFWVAVVGGIVYFWACNATRFPPGLGELGRLAFGIGLAVYLYKLA